MLSRLAYRMFVLSALASYGCAEDVEGGELGADSTILGEDGWDEEPELAEITVTRNPIPRSPSSGGKEQADPLPNTCTPDEGRHLLEMYFAAGLAVGEALKSTPRDDPQRWNNWFSAGVTQAQQDHVTAILNDIGNRTLNSEVRCMRWQNAGTPEFGRCNQVTVLAYVNLDTPIIYLCPRFFDASAIWQVNALVHEAAHLSLREADYTADGSVLRAQILASADFQKALKNASNFAHFVTNNPAM